MAVMRADTEATFSRQIENLATFYGWHLRYHTHDSQRSEPGFPDWVFIREPEILFWELKGPKTRIKPEQKRWIAALQACGLEAGIYRPGDFDDMHARLARGRQLQPVPYRGKVTA